MWHFGFWTDSVVPWWVGILGIEVAERAIEAVGGGARSRVDDEVLGLGCAVLARHDGGATGGAEQKCGRGGEMHSGALSKCNIDV